MSGAGRKHKAKHLCAMHSDNEYDLQDGELVVRLLELRGNHYRVSEDGEEQGSFLVRLPAKFNKVIWIKKDDLIVVKKENDVEGDTGVCGCVVHRLSAKQIKYLQKLDQIQPNLLAGGATTAAAAAVAGAAAPAELENTGEGGEGGYESDEDSGNPWMQGNPNVAPAFDDDDEEDEEEEEDDE